MHGPINVKIYVLGINCLFGLAQRKSHFFHSVKYWVRHVWDVRRNARTRTYIHTYLLTPWDGFLLEKLTGFHLVKKFPAFYGTRRFITAFTSARHLSLFWAVWTFRNKIRFYSESLLAPRPTPKLEGHLLSAVCDCLFNIFTTALHIVGRSSVRNRRTLWQGTTYHGRILDWYVLIKSDTNLQKLSDRTSVLVSSRNLQSRYS
jgi:hypothetical protein